MEFVSNGNIIFMGFVVWLMIAPRRKGKQSGSSFLAYMVALLFSLLASSDLLLIKPVAFFFTVGGVLAFFVVIARNTIRITTNNSNGKSGG
ncbi:hypothetical protein Ga0466249_004603 [Sporomusaceae bacterium BoRhaA]|uniref:hypothetical protein n=1 Tax=Pelorhabdus rhamnosifermentans TaxID=2772457 RepID=UPI001C061CD5|nr:hypothetical protein [Pelorhabdus rhamnosifermentans]MBU2703458.1 hypothetical protein [Pelorhabdus rhamnosifermentans]